MTSPKTLLACLLLLAAPATARAGETGDDARRPFPLGDADRAALAAAEDVCLGELRAADGQTAASPSAAERDALARAQAADPGLAALRAGELTEREITLILATAGIVVLIGLLL